MKKQVMNCTFKQNCYFVTKRQIDRTQRDKETIMKDKADTSDARCAAVTDDVEIDACNDNSYSTTTCHLN